MSKYGWGWIWKSWLSPIGLLFRMFGYKPVEDLSTDPNEIKWDLTVMPVLGYTAKEMVKDGNKLLGEFFDKDFVNNSVSGFIEAQREGDYFDIMEHFTFQVSPEEREHFIKKMESCKSWKIWNDEYRDVLSQADWEYRFHKQRHALVQRLEELVEKAEREGMPTRQDVVQKVSREHRDEYDDDEEFAA